MPAPRNVNKTTKRQSTAKTTTSRSNNGNGRRSTSKASTANTAQTKSRNGKSSSTVSKNGNGKPSSVNDKSQKKDLDFGKQPSEPNFQLVGKFTLTESDIAALNTRRGVVKLLKSRNVKLGKVIEIVRYEEQLTNLQIELIKFQRWIQETGQRIAILFEGRDAAGKGGTIRRFTEHLNPRALRIVALPKPTDTEQGQWYFQRYAKQLPNKGELVFFDRSWYNRAVVEPVNGFCSNSEYKRFIRQVPEFEHMLYESGISIVKFWFSISKAEQKARFESRRINPLKQWKLSPIDEKAQDLWSKYTSYKEDMFSKTHTSFSPWIIVKANDKKTARLESIRFVLDRFDYDGKSDENTRIFPDPNIVTRFHRSIKNID